MSFKPGEYDTGRQEENIELKNTRQQDQEEIDNQFKTPDRFEDANENLDEQQQETDFRGGQQQQVQEVQSDVLGGTSLENRDCGEIGDARNAESDNFKEKEFRKYFDIPMRKDMSLEFFQKTKFIPRKSRLSTGKISYEGKDISYIEKGRVKVYQGVEIEAQNFFTVIEDIRANVWNANTKNAIIVHRGLTIGKID